MKLRQEVGLFEDLKTQLSEEKKNSNLKWKGRGVAGLPRLPLAGEIREEGLTKSED